MKYAILETNHSTPVSQYHNNAKMQGSRPPSSIISMAKRRAQGRVPTIEEPCVSVITTPITGPSTARVMRIVNLYYGGFLGDNFTPKTPINISVCYWRGIRILSWGILKKELNSSTNLLSPSFFPSLFEIPLDRNCAIPSVIWREDSQKLDVHLINGK